MTMYKIRQIHEKWDEAAQDIRTRELVAFLGSVEQARPCVEEIVYDYLKQYVLAGSPKMYEKQEHNGFITQSRGISFCFCKLNPDDGSVDETIAVFVEETCEGEAYLVQDEF